ncbi:MAG TPA: FliA/WhiG family RNA polymerase sigma factor [Candidatus Methylomirabilis sp.]|nr:FliA/WhiG family RNA polymerase sigma factor [Candidatus Methylomirabilis sp.]
MTDSLLPLWRRYRKSHAPELRETLIRHHIGLVRKVAGRLSLRLPPHVDLDDLESAGVPGLLAAVETFDPEKDVEFGAYAQARIRGAILDELRSLDPLPRSLREKARQIERAITVLEQRLLRAPTDEEVADHLQVPMGVYHQVLHELRGGLHVSLDSGWGGGHDEEDNEGGGSPAVEGRGPSPWQALALKERQAVLGAVIEALPRNERTVLSLYYYEELTMKEIGAVLDVSESRVSQIHSAALLRIRSRLRRRKLQPEDLHVEDRRRGGRLRLVRATP